MMSSTRYAIFSYSLFVRLSKSFTTYKVLKRYTVRAESLVRLMNYIFELLNVPLIFMP